MKTDTLKKSLLDYAIKGKLTARFRRENNGLNAFNEINTYNEAIKEKRKDLEKKLKICEKEFKLEKDKDKKALFKSQIQILKKELTKCKEITPLFCHTEPLGEVSNNTESTTSIIAKRKGVYPLPAPLNPEKNKAAAVSFRQSRGEPRLSASSTQAEAGHYCPPFSAFAHNEAGESEAPFEIPNSWAWVKLGDICEIFTGATPKTSNAENFGDFIPFLNPGDIDNNGNVIYSNRGLTEKGLKEARKIEANSILVVCIGGLIGKACLVDRECTCNQQINVAKPLFAEATLLYYFINSTYFQSTIKANSTGTATPIINKNLFEQILIPLPPLREQEYIAQMLDTLFTLKKGLRVE